MGEYESNSEGYNNIKNDTLATRFGKYHYEEDLTDDVYEVQTHKVTTQTLS